MDSNLSRAEVNSFTAQSKFSFRINSLKAFTDTYFMSSDFCLHQHTVRCLFCVRLSLPTFKHRLLQSLFIIYLTDLCFISLLTVSVYSAWLGGSSDLRENEHWRKDITYKAAQNTPIIPCWICYDFFLIFRLLLNGIVSLRTQALNSRYH